MIADQPSDSIIVVGSATEGDPLVTIRRDTTDPTMGADPRYRRSLAAILLVDGDTVMASENFRSCKFRVTPGKHEMTLRPFHTPPTMFWTNLSIDRDTTITFEHRGD
jgi:hypothetical protein